MASFRFEAIGTTWHIDIRQQLTKQDEERILTRIHTRIGLFDKAYSRFREDSWVSQLAREGGTHMLPNDGTPLFSLYEKMYRVTNGAVTPLIGQVLVDAGYDATYSLVPKTLHTPKYWDEIISINGDKITLAEPALLDFGAAGKGYLIDIVGDILAKERVNDYTINAGGDILHKTSIDTPLRVGLEDPQDISSIIGVATLPHGSICGSAGNRRTWADFHHIINPHTLTSPRDILAVWVIAETALLADGLTTCLFFTPAEELAKTFRFSYLLLKADRSLEGSEDFPAEIF